MPSMTEQKLHLLPEWTISQAGKSLIISGGADARYEIELIEDKPSFFASLKPGQLFTRARLNIEDQRILEELITAEIIVPDLQKAKVLKVTLLGDKGMTFAGSKTVSIVKNLENFAVIVRANSTYSNLLANIGYQHISVPHLFVDLAFHHTVSIGPLVFPGETACIACLQGRITTLWGDEAPPSTPRIQDKYKNVTNELVITELERIANGDTSLTNKTVSWNFQDRTTRKDQLLKVPLCPVCTQNEIDLRGALALPWRQA